MYNGFTVNQFNLQRFTVQPQTGPGQFSLHQTSTGYYSNLQKQCSTSLFHSKEASVNIRLLASGLTEIISPGARHMPYMPVTASELE
jgi:hypothetical protein